MIARLRLGLSSLRDYTLRQGFRNTLNPLCSCGNEAEAIAH